MRSDKPVKILSPYAVVIHKWTLFWTDIEFQTKEFFFASPTLLASTIPSNTLEKQANYWIELVQSDFLIFIF